MGSKSGGQTQRVEPPSYQLPYLQSGLARAEQLYMGGGQPSAVQGVAPAQSRTMTALERRFGRRANEPAPPAGGPPAPPGSIPSAPGQGQAGTVPIAGFTPDQLASQDILRARVVGGDPTINSAQDYVRTSLNGGFMNSNPYLDQAFERARMATQGGLASEFARSGRNVDQSEGNRAQQLNDLASQIYGGAYNNERNLQQSSLGYAQPLGNQLYTDLGMLNQSGQTQQQQNQRVADAPSTALDQYLARVRGTDYGSNSFLPGEMFSGSGALGGAMLGNMIFPGLGGIIGGGVLGGLF